MWILACLAQRDLSFLPDHFWVPGPGDFWTCFYVYSRMDPAYGKYCSKSHRKPHKWLWNEVTASTSNLSCIWVCICSHKAKRWIGTKHNIHDLTETRIKLKWLFVIFFLGHIITTWGSTFLNQCFHPYGSYDSALTTITPTTEAVGTEWQRDTRTISTSVLPHHLQNFSL